MKLPRWFTLTLAATALLCPAGLCSAKADSTNLLTLTTFEAEVYDPDTGEVVTPAQRPPWNPYTYPYSWGYADPAPDSQRTLDTYYLDGPEQTNTVMSFWFDNTAYEPIPNGGGYGLGVGGPQNWIDKDPSVLSTNKEDYILSFDARADGLLPGTTGGAEAQTIFVVPDDTVLPADDNADPETVFQLNMGFQLTGEWKHYVFNLGKASFGGGSSQELMAQYQSLVNEIRFGFNLHMPHETFGFDGDNSVYIDNLKVEVIKRDEQPAVPTTEQTIADWNFDDRPAEYTYPYNWVEGEGHSFNSFTVGINGNSYGVDASQAWTLQFDNANFADIKPAWAGGGTGIGGPFNSAYIDTTNMAAYKVYFDARVLGLAEGKTGTSGQMQFRLRAPDDTVSPADEGEDDDLFFQVNYNVTLKSNWQTFSFTFDQGDFNDANFAQFAQLYRLTSSLQPQFQIDAAASDFGNDADNVVSIDNLRFVRITQSAPPMTVTRQGTDLVISWTTPNTGTVKLQSATSAAGPYTEVPSASSPYTAPTTGVTSRFFRTVWVP